VQLTDIELVRTKYQDIFAIYHNDDMVGNSLRRYGEYQQVEIDVLLQLINDRTVVYDIGSNVGYHATAFASCAKTVYCFEANPRHFDILRTNIGGRPNCLLFNMAVSSAEGEILVEDFDSSQLGNYGSVRVGATSGTRVIKRSLDTLNIQPPDLMKIDVEGHELDVIRGAYHMIKQHRPIIYFEAQETTDLPEIYLTLSGLNYNLGWCVVRNYNPENFRNNPENVFGDTAIFSIIAFPAESGHTWPLLVQGPDDSWQKLLERSKISL
jgi:FkbM family methyltransferase